MSPDGLVFPIRPGETAGNGVGRGHLNFCHVSVLLILQIPAKNQEATRLQEERKNPWKHLVSKDLVETTGLEPVTSCV